MHTDEFDATVVRIAGELLIVGDDAHRVDEIRPLSNGLCALLILRGDRNE